jgi:hypothetical protein
MIILLVVAIASVLFIISLFLLCYIVVRVRDAMLATLIAPYLEQANREWCAASFEARHRMLIESRVATNYVETLIFLEWGDLLINVRTAFINIQTRMESELGLTPRMRSRLVLCQLTQPHKMHPADRMYAASDISVHSNNENQTLKRVA